MPARKKPVLAGCLTALLCFALPSLASAAVDKGVNAIRQRGCEGKAGLRTALRRSRGLDEVAREWSKGGRLTGAIARTDYRVANSASMHIEGARNEKAVLQIVASDRPGLLYGVARTLARYRLNLHTARINTLGDRAEDVFLVSGEALTQPKTVLQLEQELLSELSLPEATPPRETALH